MHHKPFKIARPLPSIFGYILVMLSLVSCDTDPSKVCPPPVEHPISKATVQGTASDPQDKKNKMPSGVFIFLDGSGSMKGYLAPGIEGGGRSELFTLARYHKALSSLYDSVSSPSTNVQAFMAFEGDDIRKINSPEQWRALIGSDCFFPYQNKKTFALKPACSLNQRAAYKGQNLSHRKIFQYFLDARTNAKEQELPPPEVAVVASDLLSFNSTAPGDASEIIAPLQNLMDQGLSVALVSLWTGFDGDIVDLPPRVAMALNSPTPHLDGLMPLHLLMAGEHDALIGILNRLDEHLNNGSDKIDEKDRSVWIFDPKTVTYSNPGAFSIHGLEDVMQKTAKSNTDTKAKEGWRVLNQKQLDYGLYLTLQHQSSGGQSSDEVPITLGWEDTIDSKTRNPGGISSTISVTAWQVKGGASVSTCLKDPSSVWEKLSKVDAEALLGIKEQQGLKTISLLNNVPDLYTTYALELTLTAKPTAELNSQGQAFIKDWTLPEKDAPKRIPEILQAKGKPDQRRLPTLNLDQIIYGLWLKTKELTNINYPEAEHPTPAQSVILEQK